MCIRDRRLSDAKAWLIKLQQIDGRGYSSIHSIRGVLRPAFQMEMCIRDSLQIGDYAFHTYYEDGSYEIEIAYTGE